MLLKFWNSNILEFCSVRGWPVGSAVFPVRRDCLCLYFQHRIARQARPGRQQLENVFNFTVVRRSCCSAWFPCESSGIKYSRNSVIKIKHNYQHSHLPALQSTGNLPDIDICGLHSTLLG